MTRFTDHRPGRLARFDCPCGKWTYESEKYAVRALRWMREHGEIRQGYVYRCDRSAAWHITSGQRTRKKK
jgi:hypothetical protein